MNLLYYRIGFASNSSSMHSTWHVDDPKKIRDSIESMEFEWDMFICSSRSAIRKYLAAQLIMNMRGRIPNIVIASIIRFLYPEIKVSLYYEHGEITADVDHQSIWFFPRELHEMSCRVFPSFEFVKDVEEYLVRKKCVIVGGNDNCDIDDDELDFRKLLGCQNSSKNMFLDEVVTNHNTTSVCVKDGEVWKTFDRQTGKKLRFSFKDGIEYNKSTHPELIDLIISNRCSHGCPYCYRGCTSESEVANIDSVTSALSSIEHYMNTFEVAIGGGNIVEYPDLEELCLFIKNSIHTKGTFVCNTTLSWKDFTNENVEKIKLIFSTFRGVAVSISSKEQIEHVVDYRIQKNISYINSNAKMSFQCIPELMSYNDIMDIIFSEQLKKIPYSITFLGFKHTGRGNSPMYSAADFENGKEGFRRFISEIPKLRKNNEFYEESWSGGMYPRTIGVDTQLIKNFPELKDTQESWCYNEEEGKFSCCIDLVSGYLLPSSFSKYKEEYKLQKSRWEGYETFNIAGGINSIYSKF